MINRDIPSPPVQRPPGEQREHSVPARRKTAHVLLLVAFAFTVMADPISSVAYAIEAALRALAGNLALLLPTMVLVIVVIAIVTMNYHQLVARFPDGGGSAAAAGAAFGEGWTFLPIGALVVSFTLVMNLMREWPLLSLAAAGVVAFAFFGLWVRAGRPRGIALAVQQAEKEGTPITASEERRFLEGT